MIWLTVVLMAYGGFKDLSRRAASDKVLCDKPFAIYSNLQYDGYQRGLAAINYNSFDKKSKGGAIKSEIISN